MKDITSFRLLATKALMFVVLVVIAAVLLIARMPELTSLLPLVICVWAFARAYYFLFYVAARCSSTVLMLMPRTSSLVPSS